MVNIWQDGTKAIPKSDSRIDRIPFNKNDIGARPSHINGAMKKNDHVIMHVKGK